MQGTIYTQCGTTPSSITIFISRLFCKIEKKLYCKGWLYVKTQCAEIIIIFVLHLKVKQNLIKNEYQPLVNVWFESDKVNWFLRGGSGVISERSRSEIGCITVRRSQPSRSTKPPKFLFLYNVFLYNLIFKPNFRGGQCSKTNSTNFLLVPPKDPKGNYVIAD